jgi:hypothetical protein
MQQEKPSADYDGIYFLPGDEQGELVLSYFDFSDEMAGGVPVENTNHGSKYHIAFFQRGDDGKPVFDESFEAILGDPALYIKNLAGSELFGCVVKKTTKSDKWFDNYLKRINEQIETLKTISLLKSILNMK